MPSIGTVGTKLALDVGPISIFCLQFWLNLFGLFGDIFSYTAHYALDDRDRPFISFAQFTEMLDNGAIFMSLIVVSVFNASCITFILKTGQLSKAAVYSTLNASFIIIIGLIRGEYEGVVVIYIFCVYAGYVLIMYEKKKAARAKKLATIDIKFVERVDRNGRLGSSSNMDFFRSSVSGMDLQKSVDEEIRATVSSGVGYQYDDGMFGPDGDIKPHKNGHDEREDHFKQAFDVNINASVDENSHDRLSGGYEVDENEPNGTPPQNDTFSHEPSMEVGLMDDEPSIEANHKIQNEPEPDDYEDPNVGNYTPPDTYLQNQPKSDEDVDSLPMDDHRSDEQLEANYSDNYPEEPNEGSEEIYAPPAYTSVEPENLGEQYPPAEEPQPDYYNEGQEEPDEPIADENPTYEEVYPTYEEEYPAPVEPEYVDLIPVGPVTGPSYEPDEVQDPVDTDDVKEPIEVDPPVEPADSPKESKDIEPVDQAKPDESELQADSPDTLEQNDPVPPAELASPEPLTEPVNPEPPSEPTPDPPAEPVEETKEAPADAPPKPDIVPAEEETAKRLTLEEKNIEDKKKEVIIGDPSPTFKLAAQKMMANPGLLAGMQTKKDSPKAEPKQEIGDDDGKPGSDNPGSDQNE